VALLVDLTWTPLHRSTGRRFTAEEARRLCHASDEDSRAAKELLDAERDLIRAMPWLTEDQMPWHPE
jgi:hypothetical protein